MKYKIEISEEEIRKARQSANHAANFDFNTIWGPVAIRVVALSQLPPSQKKQELPRKSGWGNKYFGVWQGNESSKKIIHKIKEARGKADFTFDLDKL